MILSGGELVLYLAQRRIVDLGSATLNVVRLPLPFSPHHIKHEMASF